jgi:hypothetical protein
MCHFRTQCGKIIGKFKKTAQWMTRFLVGKPEEKRPLGGGRILWGNNFKLDIKAIN